MQSSPIILTDQTELLHIEPYAQVTIFYAPKNNSAAITKKFILHDHSSLLLIPVFMDADKLQLSIELELYNYAHAIVQGAYALHHTQVLTVNTLQHHIGTQAASHVMINGIVNDVSRVNYSGTIKIKKSASKSNASQENKTIILDQRSQVISVPALEVETNDVQCAHGNAMGPLNQEHIQYMQSRGLSLFQAKKLLFSSFFYQCLHRLNDKNELDRMLDQLINKMLHKE